MPSLAKRGRLSENQLELLNLPQYPMESFEEEWAEDEARKFVGAMTRLAAPSPGIPMLTHLIEEMRDRYERFANVSADNLLDYQRKTGLQLPRLVCVVDEHAELLMGTRKKADREQVETHFVRIAQMSRAAGIHLVLATQRPSRQVVTGVLKANIPGRVALRVSNRIESGVVLDQSGAEFLLGRGDLLLAAGTSSLVRLQSAYLTDADRQQIFRDN
jgi:DNA segregation ATPase FtsK/SpoIIIE, S-DNA-T family